MKKILIIAILILLIGSISYAGNVDWCKSSGALSADTQIATSSGVLCGFIVHDAGSDAVVELWDSETSTLTGDTALLPTDAVVTDQSVDVATRLYTFPVPIRFFKGLYLDVTTIDTIVVYYRLD